MRTLLKVSILLLLACGIAAARKAPVRNPKMAAADPGTSSEDRQSQLYCHMVVQQIECKTFHNYCFEGPISCKVMVGRR